MMVNHAFWSSRGSRSVVERQTLPFIFGQLPRERKFGIPDQAFVVVIPTGQGYASDRIIDLNDFRLRAPHGSKGVFCQLDKLRIDNEDLRPGMIKNIGNGGPVEADVDGIQNGAAGRYTKMGLRGGRNIGKKC